MLILPVRLATLIRVLVLYYAVYLTFFECRGDYSQSNQVAQYTCRQLHRSVYPIWTSQVKPQWDVLDKKYQVSAKVVPVFDHARAQVASFDEQYEISYKLDTWWANAHIWATDVFGDLRLKVELVLGLQLARAKLYYEGSVAPISKHYISQYQKSWGHSVDSLKSKAKVNSELLFTTSKRHSSRFLTLHVAPFYERVWLSISSNAYVVKVVEYVRPQLIVDEFKLLLAKLQQKSAEYSSKLQAKTDFLRAEINNFNKIDELKKKWKGDAFTIVDVINDLLEDVKTSEPISPDTKEAEESEGSDDDEDVVVTLTYTRTQTSTVTQSVLGSPSQGSEGPEDSGAALASVDQTEEGVTNYGEDSSKAQIDYELKYWTSKVDKTLDLAYNSLESDMKDFLNETVAQLKDKISANFTELQQSNYKRYKVMGELIAAIDKDSEVIRETGEIIEEPKVDRQIMRDKIKEGYEVAEGTMKDIEAHLNDAHFKIMEKYFEVVQNTVDVLESFAETTILDFSNRLTGLIEILESNEDFEDELSWSAWKLFHKVKDLIFTIRDKIFQEAEAYKVKPRGNIKPKGLQLWVEYLDNVNFHIRFLLSDNDEYLKLVRAKANVAYQLREGLTRQLIAEAKEKAEAEAQAEAQAKEEASPQQVISNEDIPEVETPPQKESVEEEAPAVQQEPVVPESIEVPVLEDIEEENEEGEEEEEEGEASEEAVAEEPETPEEASDIEISAEEFSDIMDILHGNDESETDVPVEEVSSELPEASLARPAEPTNFDEDNIVEEIEASEDAPEKLEATD